MPSFWEMWETLSTIGCDVDGGTTRLAFSEADVKGRQYILHCMEQVGLASFIDGIGNVVGRFGGPPYVVIGSHTDTVPQGGNYDGIIGVLAGIHIAATWPRSARHGLIVVDWSSEESSRFGISTIGSRASLGELPSDTWLAHDSTATTLQAAAHAAFGYPDVAIWSVPTADVKASVELHIEQGRELADAKYPVASVLGIAAPQRWSVALSGKPDHTGSAAMGNRQDALCGAAEVVLMVEQTSRQMEVSGLRSTVSRLVTRPGVSNIVPHQVDLLIDVRAQSESLLRGYETALDEKLIQLHRERGLTGSRQIISAEGPSELSRDVVELIRQTIHSLGLPYRSMTSWPSHDSLVLSRHLPAGMIFVRNVSGVSHSPKEFCTRDDVDMGLQVLNTALRPFH